MRLKDSRFFHQFFHQYFSPIFTLIFALILSCIFPNCYSKFCIFAKSAPCRANFVPVPGFFLFFGCYQNCHGKYLVAEKVSKPVLDKVGTGTEFYCQNFEDLQKIPVPVLFKNTRFTRQKTGILLAALNAKQNKPISKDSGEVHSCTVKCKYLCVRRGTSLCQMLPQLNISIH